MIKNGSTRRAMRHLHRAQELLDSHGFGSDAEYEQDNPRENDFGGIKDWLINLKNSLNNTLDKQDRTKDLSDELLGRIMKHVPDKNVNFMRGANRAGRRVGTGHLEEEAKKKANDPNAFMEAVKDNNAFMVKLLLENKEIIITRKDSLSALGMALRKGNSAIVNLLLDNGKIGKLSHPVDWIRLFIWALQLETIRDKPLNFSMAGLLLEKGSALLSRPTDLNQSFEYFIHTMKECHDERAVGIVKTFLSKGATYDEQLYEIIKDGAKESDFYKQTAKLLEEYPQNKEL